MQLNFDQTLATIATALAVWFVHKAISVFSKKTKIQVSAQTEQIITDAITQAIAAAEEQFASKKDPTGSAGATKLQTAMLVAKGILEKHGISLADGELIARINATVNQVFHR